ncbi:sulfite oxidase [Deinococcus yavapaiensis]|uniref:Sulfite dehydrogenase (Cytochrome) subunit SorA apoprotein n=1 Tax=Deinococcus yavapaiensis KR-236 TaxID=694435 RepID=A0A318S3G2_9DEIO|nr:sulfite oxidase [Deinococcus yavapaiensis]PYE48951.1 sulfite dehydrogenase (cytochrome) subunit SorA apoprotein [Deinococcus yavapaiensis KR-236]
MTIQDRSNLPTTLAEKRAALRPLEDRGEVLETPLALLRAYRFTPQSVAFVRNSNPYPEGTETLEAPSMTGTLEVGGLIGRPFTLDLADLASFPLREVEAVMQCAGNGRAFYRDAHLIEGCQWGRGGVMNVLWGGVPLSALLADSHVLADARFLTATGGDGDGDGFEKSVPLADALDVGIVAYRMNGEALGGVHGGPARLLVPGFYGTVNVKWLRKLTLTRDETSHEAQQERYRTLHPDGRRTPCWRQLLKSVIWTPEEGEIVRGTVTFSGCAFNDGRSSISKVELSVDGGRSWSEATLEVESSRFGWRRWELVATLARGEHEVWCRATDEHGVTQPLDPEDDWNPDGYEFNAADKVRFEVR